MLSRAALCPLWNDCERPIKWQPFTRGQLLTVQHRYTQSSGGSSATAELLVFCAVIAGVDYIILSKRLAYTNATKYQYQRAFSHVHIILWRLFTYYLHGAPPPQKSTGLQITMVTLLNLSRSWPLNVLDSKHYTTYMVLINSLFVKN